MFAQAKSRRLKRRFVWPLPLIAATPGYIRHQLRRCVETTGRYLLLVEWETLEAHTVGFRESANYLEWKRMLRHFYDPFPVVEHYEELMEFSRGL